MLDALQRSALLPGCGFVIRLIAVQAPVIIYFTKVIVPQLIPKIFSRSCTAQEHSVKREQLLRTNGNQNGIENQNGITNRSPHQIPQLLAGSADLAQALGMTLQSVTVQATHDHAHALNSAI